MIKCEITKFSMDYSRIIARERHENITILTEIIDRLEKKVVTENKPSLVSQLENTKRDLDDLMEEKSRTFVFHSARSGIA